MMAVSAKPSRRILLRTVPVIIAAVAVIAALIAGILAPYYLSVHVVNTSLLTLLAVMAFGIIVWLGMCLCAALWRSVRPARFAAVCASALTVVFFIGL
jgi:hypothetical protein